MREPPYLVKTSDNASSIVSHIESTIAIQRTAVFPVHFTPGSESHLGDSSWIFPRDNKR